MTWHLFIALIAFLFFLFICIKGTVDKIKIWGECDTKSKIFNSVIIILTWALFYYIVVDNPKTLALYHYIMG